MILRIYFRRKTERQPIYFDVVLQPSSRDDDYVRQYARQTEEALRAALSNAGADFTGADKPLRHCANIEYRLRVHRRTGEMFWDAPIINCDSNALVATCNAAIRIREILERKEDSAK